MMLDTSPLYADVEIISEFVLVTFCELPTEKCSNIIGLDGMDGRSCNGIVKRCECTLAFE